MCKVITVTVVFARMQTVSAQPVLLRRPRPPKSSVFDSVGQTCSRNVNTEQNAAAFRLNNSGFISDNNGQEQASPTPTRPWPCQSSLAFNDGWKVQRKLRGLPKGDRAVKLKSIVHPRKPCGPDAIQARSYNQKPHVLHAAADDEDRRKFYRRQPQFTLRDFIVQFSANEDVPVSVVEKSVCSPTTYCKLQHIIKEQCRPRNTQLSTQLLELPDDLPEVCHRVPRKQLLIEMTAVIKEHLSKVDY